MSAMASQITSLTRLFTHAFIQAQIKEKNQSSASLAFVRGIHQWPVNSPHKKASNAENVSIWWRHNDQFAHDTLTWLQLSGIFLRRSLGTRSTDTVLLILRSDLNYLTHPHYGRDRRWCRQTWVTSCWMQMPWCQFGVRLRLILLIHR